MPVGRLMDQTGKREDLPVTDSSEALTELLGVCQTQAAISEDGQRFARNWRFAVGIVGSAVAAPIYDRSATSFRAYLEPAGLTSALGSPPVREIRR